MLFAYLEKCKIKHAVKFFEWRRQQAEEAKKIQEFMNIISQKRESLKIFETYLYKNMDTTILDVNLQYA